MDKATFERRLAQATKNTDKALEVFKKAHAQVEKETAELTKVIDDIETQIAELRATRDKVIDKTTANEKTLLKLFNVFGNE